MDDLFLILARVTHMTLNESDASQSFTRLNIKSRNAHFSVR